MDSDLYWCVCMCVFVCVCVCVLCVLACLGSCSCYFKGQSEGNDVVLSLRFELGLG